MFTLSFVLNFVIFYSSVRHVYLLLIDNYSVTYCDNGCQLFVCLALASSKKITLYTETSKKLSLKIESK